MYCYVIHTGGTSYSCYGHNVQGHSSVVSLFQDTLTACNSIHGNHVQAGSVSVSALLSDTLGNDESHGCVKGQCDIINLWAGLSGGTNVTWGEGVTWRVWGHDIHGGINVIWGSMWHHQYGGVSFSRWKHDLRRGFVNRSSCFSYLEVNRLSKAFLPYYSQWSQTPRVTPLHWPPLAQPLLFPLLQKPRFPHKQ